MDLLFELNNWHALAQLRMHTSTTLGLMDAATGTLGDEARKFVATTCEAFETRELDREVRARARRKANIALRNGRTASSTSEPTVSKRLKKLNINTYKWHALGHVPNTIRRYGTTESYSTQRVSDIFSSLIFTSQLIILLTGRAGASYFESEIHANKSEGFY